MGNEAKLTGTEMELSNVFEALKELADLIKGNWFPLLKTRSHFANVFSAFTFHDRGLGCPIAIGDTVYVSCPADKCSDNTVTAVFPWSLYRRVAYFRYDVSFNGNIERSGAVGLARCGFDRVIDGYAGRFRLYRCVEVGSGSLPMSNEISVPATVEYVDAKDNEFNDALLQGSARKIDVPRPVLLYRSVGFAVARLLMRREYVELDKAINMVFAFSPNINVWEEAGDEVELSDELFVGRRYLGRVEFLGTFTEGKYVTRSVVPRGRYVVKIEQRVRNDGENLNKLVFVDRVSNESFARVRLYAFSIGENWNSAEDAYTVAMFAMARRVVSVSHGCLWQNGKYGERIVVIATLPRLEKRVEQQESNQQQDQSLSDNR